MPPHRDCLRYLKVKSFLLDWVAMGYKPSMAVRGSLFFFIFLILNLLIHTAFAGMIQLPQTGQDGDIQAGVAWPSLRFTNNCNNTVTDNLTGLMWAKVVAFFTTVDLLAKLNIVYEEKRS